MVDGEIAYVVGESKSGVMEYFSRSTYLLAANTMLFSTQSLVELRENIKRFSTTLEETTYVMIYPWDLSNLDSKTNCTVLDELKEIVAGTCVRLLIGHISRAASWNFGLHAETVTKIDRVFLLVENGSKSFVFEQLNKGLPK